MRESLKEEAFRFVNEIKLQPSSPPPMKRRIECPRCKVPLGILGQRLSDFPFLQGQRARRWRATVETRERVEQSRKRGFGVDERSSNRANLYFLSPCTSLLISRILRASDFKAKQRNEEGEDGWKKEVESKRKQCRRLGGARPREYLLSLSLPSFGWSTSVCGRNREISVHFVLLLPLERIVEVAINPGAPISWRCHESHERCLNVFAKEKCKCTCISKNKIFLFLNLKIGFHRGKGGYL